MALKGADVLGDLCLQFELFDFNGDETFQAGWQKIKGKSLSEDTLQERSLDAKLFYFSRKVQPLSKEDYISWKKSTNDEEEKTGNSGNSERVEEDALGQQGTKPILETTHSLDRQNVFEDSGKGPSIQQSNIDGDQLEYPTSFMDIINLVQEGKEIPGLAELDIQPTNTAPSKSEMTKPKKPWEK